MRCTRQDACRMGSWRSKTKGFAAARRAYLDICHIRVCLVLRDRVWLRRCRSETAPSVQTRGQYAPPPDRYLEECIDVSGKPAEV